MFMLLQQVQPVSQSLTWPEAFTIVGGAVAFAWIARSFFRAALGHKP